MYTHNLWQLCVWNCTPLYVRCSKLSIAQFKFLYKNNLTRKIQHFTCSTKSNKKYFLYHDLLCYDFLISINLSNSNNFRLKKSCSYTRYVSNQRNAFQLYVISYDVYKIPLSYVGVSQTREYHTIYLYNIISSCRWAFPFFHMWHSAQYANRF